MTKDSKELRDFIEWARTQRIKKIKVSKGTTEVEFSDLAYIDGIAISPDIEYASNPPQVNEEKSNSSKTLTDTLEANPNEDDEDLFWSSIP